MYAQLVEGGTTPDQREQMNRIVTEELVPALQEEPGFAGALNLADDQTGDGLMVILWETEAQARRALGEYGSAFLRALAGIAHISTGVRRPISGWSVNAQTEGERGAAAALLRIPPLGRYDREPLADAFARLSEESRYRRFLGPKKMLTVGELHELTELDHLDRDALGAFERDSGRLVGVARYATNSHNRSSADIAITVADEW